MAVARTTVRLDPALLSAAKRKAAEEGTTVTALIERGLREQVQSAPPVWERPRASGYGGMRPGIDPTSNRSLLDAADGLLDET